MQNGSDVLQGRRVLIVEDEMLVAMELETVVAGHGATVCGPAASVDRALQLLESERPDAAILDVNLDGENATPVAAALRARCVPFMLATGYAEAQMHDPELLGVPRLDKPVNHARLICALARILEAGA